MKLWDCARHVHAGGNGSAEFHTYPVTTSRLLSSLQCAGIEEIIRNCQSACAKVWYWSCALVRLGLAQRITLEFRASGCTISTTEKTLKSYARIDIRLSPKISTPALRVAHKILEYTLFSARNFVRTNCKGVREEKNLLYRTRTANPQPRRQDHTFRHKTIHVQIHAENEMSSRSASDVNLMNDDGDVIVHELLDVAEQAGADEGG